MVGAGAPCRMAARRHRERMCGRPASAVAVRWRGASVLRPRGARLSLVDEEANSPTHSEENRPGRRRSCPRRLPQIRTGPIKASGSSRRGLACVLLPAGVPCTAPEARCPRPVAHRPFRNEVSPSLGGVPTHRFPRPQRYSGTLRLLLPVPPSLMTLGGTTAASGPFAPSRRRRSAGRPGGLRVRRPRDAASWCPWRQTGIPRSWATLMTARSGLRPRRDRWSPANTGHRRGPHLCQGRGLSRPSNAFGAQCPSSTGSLPTLRSPGLPGSTHGSLPTAAQALSGGIGYPQGCCERFPRAIVTSHPPSASFRGAMTGITDRAQPHEPPRDW